MAISTAEMSFVVHILQLMKLGLREVNNLTKVTQLELSDLR